MNSHYAGNPLSVKMLDILKKERVSKDAKEKNIKHGFLSQIFGNRKKLSSGIYRYKIDVSNSIPTKKQFDLMFTYAATSPAVKKALLSAFPKVTVTSLYNYSYAKAFPPEALHQDQTPKSQEYMIKHDFFVPPLAVDWEHRYLVSDSEDLKRLLQKYHTDSKITSN